MVPPRNQAIAAEFLRIADDLEDRGTNPYRIRAYRQAALLIGRLTEDAEDMARRGDLIKIKGIGKDLAQKVTQFCETGRIEASTADTEAVPADVAAWVTLPGFTPTLVRYLAERLMIRTLDDLEALVRSRLFRTLPEITATDDQLLEGITRLRAGSRRT
jgi:DNA polymerase (family 10)